MGGKRLIDLFLEKHNDIVEMRKQGLSYEKIGQAIGCSSTSIRKYCIENSIQGGKKHAIIGQSFEASNLTVLEVDLNPPFKSHETGYKCSCNICGGIATYRRTNVVEGPGCHKCSGTKGGRGYREWEIGQKFGFIEILDVGSRYGYILGKCECGTVREFALDHLKGRGHSRTISCGCKQKSSGEIKVEGLLRSAGVNYRTQYQIKDFSSYSLFDFAVFDENGELVKLIEYDGEQHFYAVDHFGGEEHFKIQQERDARKNAYCEEHNIPLLRIPYYDYDKVDIGYLFPNFPELD